MARGVEFETTYNSSSTDGPCRNDVANTSVAQLVLDRNQIDGDIGGSALPGYDIKSQDGLTMMRLSLLATTCTAPSTGGATLGVGSDCGFEFREVYINNQGIAVTVNVGVDQAVDPTEICLYKTLSTNFVNKVDHVIVRGRDPLPIRSNTAGITFLAGGNPQDFSVQCGLTYQPKNNSFGQEAWAELSVNPQSKETQENLRNLIDKSQWEQLVAYKYRIDGIPAHATVSPSQTTPRVFPFNFTGIGAEVSLGPLSTDPEDGGVIDVSNVNVVAAPILDIMKGTDVLALFSTSSVGTQGVPASWQFSDTDFFVLLDHTCSFYGLSRGKEWYLFPGPTVKIRTANNTDTIAYNALGGLNAIPGSTTRIFRRIVRNDGTSPTSLADFINYNANPPTDSNGAPVRAAQPAFSQAGGAVETSAAGSLEPGLGGNFGIELFQMQVAYTVQRPSLQVRSASSDAASIASSASIVASAIKITDKPTPIGYNGQIVEQPAPPNDELESFCPEPNPNIQALEGTIVDMSAPFLSEGAVASFSSNVKAYIDADTGTYENRTYVGGGYTWLPGQTLEGKTIHAVNFVYADKDSMTTNITLGPKYFQANSYNDSQYIKRSETVTRTGRVISADNSSGEYGVLIDGIGSMNAVNGITDPVFPGDRVEVKVLNYPIEP